MARSGYVVVRWWEPTCLGLFLASWDRCETSRSRARRSTLAETAKSIFRCLPRRVTYSSLNRDSVLFESTSSMLRMSAARMEMFCWPFAICMPLRRMSICLGIRMRSPTFRSKTTGMTNNPRNSRCHGTHGPGNISSKITIRSPVKTPQMPITRTQNTGRIRPDCFSSFQAFKREC